MRVLCIATIPFVVLNHLAGQIRALVAAGHEVHVITSPGAGAELIGKLGAKSTLVAIEREIAPLADLVSLARLARSVRAIRPDLVHTVTPKAGLLGALAARLCRVPVRLHTFTGQAWAERAGLVRWLARMADRVIVALNTRCYADSMSQRAYLIEQRIGTEASLRVLGKGSLGGVDFARFDRERLLRSAAATRNQLRVGARTKIVVFVGRLTRDKGVAELVDAFGRPEVAATGAVLVLVGPREPERDPLPPGTLAAIERNPAIRALGYVAAPEDYLVIADLLCLPSYREGFGTVVLEAAALGVPALGTRITGLTDAIVEGETGWLVEPKDTDALARALVALLGDDELRAALGAAARQRARADFDAAVIHARLLDEYRALAAEHSG